MQTRKRYSKEFKQDAISLVLDQGYSRAEAARNLEINTNMLCRWVQEYNQDGPEKSTALLCHARFRMA